MPKDDQVNILLVDDQPGKLLSYEVILEPLGENLIAATSGREALTCLLNTEVAVVLIDIEMPDQNGFELAATIRDHPRFEKVAIIFVSAVHFTDADTLRGYRMGAVDYVTVPVTPEILRAKVQVFAELYRKSRELERLTDALERRVEERTAELTTAVERQTILAREVDHRAKNVLTVVQSLVRLTRAPSIEKYVTAIEGRINALARSHVLLSLSHWQGADLREILEKELSPYNTNANERFTIEGPPTLLNPAATQSLTLVFHELATNAAKYGSLSTPEGRLTVKFELHPGAIVLHWLEFGGPPVMVPKANGFGTTLISISMKNLQGEAEFNWDHGGMKCKLTLPRHEEPEKIHKNTIQDEAGDDATLPQRKITALLVEDEPLIAMMMADMLTDFDFDVLGPFATVAKAISAVDQANVHVALLDVNLAGEMVYPLASRLRELGVPFIFMTGYSSESIESRFMEAPILKKPVDQAQLYRTIKRMTEMVAAN
ncbi:MAG TPA: response regulator [Aestuariivirga sp.]|nr:response regulator [Aestuariivirga sp.]